MKSIELVVDTDVASFLHKGGERGAAYSRLIAGSDAGITMLSIAEFRAGVIQKDWGLRKIAELDTFLTRFMLIETNSEIANVSGALLACCARVGRALSWPDAWAAATALWLDVPLVTHDWDLEGIPGLQVLTVHQNWQIREEGSTSEPPLWLGARGDTARYVGDRIGIR